jgi:glycosyltransferase involved in cell wall biosynthesis
MMYNNLLQLADTSGCGHYRALFPAWGVRTISRNIKFLETQFYIGDQTFYKNFRHVMVQRGVDKNSMTFFSSFLHPLSNVHGFWTSYNIDDVIGKDEIPRYNSCWEAYQDPTFHNNIKTMLNLANFVIVTTDILKQYYVDKFEVDPEKFLVIPNYLPRWWVGEAYNMDLRLKEYSDNRARPRIGFTSSLSHFDIKEQNGGIDDFTEVCKFIRATYKKYKWVFIGYCPKQLDDLALANEIEVHKSSDLLNFIREVGDKKLQMIIAPLQDNLFNRAKSNIKLIEAWALGIPFIGSNLPTYSNYTDSVFNDLNELQNKIDGILSDKTKFKKIIRENRNIIDYGNSISPNGWWLEKNLSTWYKLFTLPPKSINLDYSTVFKNLSTEDQQVSISI